MNRLLYFFALTLITFAADAQLPSIDFVTPSIVRVRWAADGSVCDNHTGVCVYSPERVKVSTRRTDSITRYTSNELIVEMNNNSGALTFRDRKTKQILLSERQDGPRESEEVAEERVIYDDASAHSVQTANGTLTEKDVAHRDTIHAGTRYRNYFAFRSDESLYGLGSHMEDYLDLNGKTMYLCQHNLKAMVPVLNSTAGYGLLFDAGCGMRFDKGCWELESAETIDYYFMRGQTMDDVVAAYRYLTGQVPMLPRYMYGYIQSRERYRSSSEILSTLGEFRRRHIPIDVIVQDWNYWPQGWGYMKMDPRYYPDPAALADSVHRMDARIMVSIWPNPQWCPEQDDFRQRGLLLEHSVYDAFNPDGRELYWKYANDTFFSKGFDAWWCDCSEPMDGDWKMMPSGYGWNNHRERWDNTLKVLSEVSGSKRSCLFSLYHSMGIYDHQRAQTDRKRVVNLTRSSYAGQQRYATIVWNGDTHASWESFRQQIPAGLNYMATGCPLWSVDIGSFFTRRDGRWFYQGDFPDGNRDPGYREYYTRMLQWGTFLPIMRSHGTDTPREPWFFGDPGTPYYDAILSMIHLRYRLIPYIYSLSAKQTRESYTMARLLAFDFAADRRVRDIKDEYMFGRILVCPVTQPGVSSRSVYLPAGERWYDYWSGDALEGGQTIEAKADISRLPLFVRQGTILPMAEVEEHTGAQIGKPLTLKVYAGADAEFTLYEDDGDTYDYEKGAYATIPISWDDSRRTLRIGATHGTYPGMPSKRTIHVCVGKQTKSIDYSGKAITLRF